MNHSKWQRVFVVATLLLTTLFPVGAALAASPAHSADFLPSCLQSLKGELGTVLPSASHESQPNQCDRLGLAGVGLIPVTGVNSSASWSDAGTSASLSGGSAGGWLDAGAGRR